MNARIRQRIQQVCNEAQITCLHAIESGSRAWGFASTDSDYDVRILYRHELDWYLRLFESKDTFEFIEADGFDVPFDIGGWELRKALRLLAQSNGMIFEWLNSPIVYHSDAPFLQEIQLATLHRA